MQRTSPRVLAILLCCAACADPRLGRIRQDTDEYIMGVQYEDTRGLVKRLGGFRSEIASNPPQKWDAVRTRYEAEMARRFADYEKAKSTGRFPLRDDGIALLQALAVGKGVYYAFEDIRLEEGGKRAVGTMLVNLDYSAHRFEPFPTGTKVFLMGKPLGTLHVVTLGEEEARPLSLVERIELEWRLAWYPAVDVYPEGWAVESIRPVPGSVRFTSWTPES